MASITTEQPYIPDIPRPAAPPPLPATLKETGLAVDFVEQLLIKTLYGGEAIGLTAADRMRLPFSMIEPLIEHARSEQLIEVRGTTSTSGAAGYRYALTDRGRDRGRL